MKATFISDSLQLLVDECAPKSALSKEKLFLLAVQLVNARRLSGACAELGVWHGGSARLIARLMPDRLVYLFDTFCGIPVQGESDRFEVGAFGDTSLDAVNGWVNSSNVVDVPGIFPRRVMPEEQYCFVHIDADQYESTRAAIKYFLPCMVPGGVMIFDDWRDPSCPGVERALCEMLEAEDPAQICLISCGNQAVVFKEGP